MNNVYDVVFKPPGITARELPPELEQLAQALVQSGRMRIDADEKINFIRFPIDNNVLFFSHRELHDKFLVRDVEAQLGADNLHILRREIKTNQPVSFDLEQKLARLFVQCNHIAVIKLILIERVEVFLSYSHNIGDLLDIESWQTHGGNSGMQSTDRYETKIYVSSGADPFDEREEAKDITKYAIARFMIIAAQETGHYADLKRDARGFKTHGRFSLDRHNYYASPKVKAARLKDINWIQRSKEILSYLHLEDAAKLEKSLPFYKKYRKYSFKHLSTIIKSYVSTKHLQQRALKFNFKIANLYNAKTLATMISDMEFNLSPQADVYRNIDKNIEEATACVEALARVPQQVIKWGHATTKFIYPNLYRIYYNEVIPCATRAVKTLSLRERVAEA